MFELEFVKPSECIECIETCFNAKLVPFIWGPPGIAKSAISQQYATSINYAFVDIRLSQMDLTDIRGIPYPIKEFGVNAVKWSSPIVLPNDLNINYILDVEIEDDVEIDFSNLNPMGSNGIRYVKNPQIELKSLDKEYVAEAKYIDQEKAVITLKKDGKFVTGKVKVKITGKAEAVIALEELNSAPPGIQIVCYQLLHDRRIGEYIVPENVSIMAMGNRQTDRGVVFNMPSPLVNRIAHYQMEMDYSEWVVWALDNNVHSSIIKYLTHFKQHLFDFDPKTASTPWASPRSWTNLSKILNANKNLKEKTLRAHVCGCVGDGIAVQYLEFLKISEKLPDPELILQGKITTIPNKKETQIEYALSSSLLYELAMKYKKAKDKDSQEYAKFLKQADTFMGFIMDNFQEEIISTIASRYVQVYKLPLDGLKNFERLAEQYLPLHL